MEYNIALVGNPNCGKTTLFNELTGSNQYVGNWSGVTVEKKSGKAKFCNTNINIVDLPGIYSLSPYTMEEIIARDYIIKSNPDLIINIIDGTNIERNMYLTIQLLELGIPIVMAVNMMDDVKSRGDIINCEGLEDELGIKVVPIVARKRENINKLMNVCESIIISSEPQTHNIVYDNNTQKSINDIKKIVSKYINSRELMFYCSKLLECDKRVEKLLNINTEDIEKIRDIVNQYEKTSKYGDKETMIADARYKIITGIVSKNVRKNKLVSSLTISDKIDMFVTNRFLAIPIFLAVILCVFGLTFGKIGTFLKNCMSYFIYQFISVPVSDYLISNNMPKWTYELLVNAVISGVGSVLEFLPQIMILFLFLSILEDSGYMARAAFIMDRFLRRLGLNGKSFIPMLMGFGCTTPAVMAARTMENENDRKLTIMLIPFMSCGARLTIYMLFTGAFFYENQGIVIFSIYFIGCSIAILTGIVLNKTLFRKNNSNFVMELPPYRFPTTKTIIRHMWAKCKGFLIKAGTIIFSMCILIWMMQNFNFAFQYVTDSSKSMIGYIGRFIAPIFKPLGFGTWQASISLIAGLVSKETVVSTMKVLYGNKLLTIFNQASAYSFMIFSLLYMPCVSAFVSIKKEIGSWKWAIGIAGMEIGIAYLISFIVYQIIKIFL